MNWREQLGTILFATLFTVLIWLWAEGENRDQRVDTAQITFTAATDAEDYMIRVRDPSDQGELRNSITVQLSLEGPNLALDRTMRNRQPLVVRVPNPAEDANRAFNLLEHLQQLARFRSEGISIERVDPPTVSLRIDRIVTRMVSVPTTVEGYEFESIEVRPERIEARMPNETWLSVESIVGNQVVELDLSQATLQALEPGRPTTLQDVALQLDPRLTALGESITLEPETVDVSLTLANRLIETTWTVPVKIMMLPRDEALYDVRIVDEQDEFIRDVRITGEPQAIERLKNREVFVYAVVNLSSDELEQNIDSKRIDWWLPPGLQAEHPERRPAIPIEITRKQQPESS